MQLIQVRSVSIEAFGSHGVTINHPIAPVVDQRKPAILRSPGAAHMVTASLLEGGTIGRHRAPMQQLLVVISGELQVSGDRGQTMRLRTGEAVLFEPREEHESVACTAATLAVIQFADSDCTA